MVSRSLKTAAWSLTVRKVYRGEKRLIVEGRSRTTSRYIAELILLVQKKAGRKEAGGRRSFRDDIVCKIEAVNLGRTNTRVGGGTRKAGEKRKNP